RVGGLRQARIILRLIIEIQAVEVDALHSGSSRHRALRQYAPGLEVIEQILLPNARRNDVQRHEGRCSFTDGQLADGKYQR
ncbi:hypothetical protein RA269_28880, partial [Pseudomonas syringae pv. tagetis]|uniref:hypothetical protein n=1 Tax=Pseudomonas syringae group genomosp. 7 TaxID=251699 RepID=UPI00376F73E0